MSTNYYFKLNVNAITSRQLGLPVSIGLVITDKINEYISSEVSTIHIGKRSCGWKPLFQKTQFYSSVKEIKSFYDENKKYITIIDEYDNTLSIEELSDNLFDWNKNKLDVKCHTPSLYGNYMDDEGYDFSIEYFS